MFIFGCCFKFFRLVKLLMGQMMARAVLFLMEFNMTMVSILLLTVASYFVFVFLNLNSFALSMIQFLMLILGMGSPLVSCPTIVLVCCSYSYILIWLFDSHCPVMIPLLLIFYGVTSLHIFIFPNPMWFIKKQMIQNLV